MASKKVTHKANIKRVDNDLISNAWSLHSVFQDYLVESRKKWDGLE